MYKYFVFSNPTSRGPLLTPGYYNLYHYHWLEIFTRYLTGDVHLVGATINCEITNHVQSYFMIATNQAVELGISNGKFNVKKGQSVWETVKNSELGFSSLLLEKGMNIAARMKKYEDWDWRKGRFETCGNDNPNLNALKKGVNPLEVLWFKELGLHKKKECKERDCEMGIVDDLSENLEKEFEEIRRMRVILPVFEG